MVTEVLERNDLEEPYLEKGDVDCTPCLEEGDVDCTPYLEEGDVDCTPCRVMLIAHHVWRWIVHHVFRRVMLIAHHILRLSLIHI